MKPAEKRRVKINSLFGKAIADYHLIADGDRLLVGFSGGKDSSTLLHFLVKARAKAPIAFTICAVHIVTEFTRDNSRLLDYIEGIARTHDVELMTRSIEVEQPGRKSGCFWCSWNRRKAFFEIAQEKGCNKVALGHHKDDIVETILMNLFYHGQISTMNPRQELFGGTLSIIRPLCYVEEALIREFADDQGYELASCSCAHSQGSQRKKIKEMIAQLQSSVGSFDIKTNIYKSLSRIREDYIDLIRQP